MTGSAYGEQKAIVNGMKEVERRAREGVGIKVRVRVRVRVKAREGVGIKVSDSLGASSLSPVYLSVFDAPCVFRCLLGRGSVTKWAKLPY